MTVDSIFFATLSLAAAVAGVVCSNVRGTGFVLQGQSGGVLSDTDPPSFRALAVLFLGLSFLFALLAVVGIWLERSSFGGPSERAYPSAWGALWVYSLLLVIEWKTTGLHGAGRRILVGAFLAGMGTLALGIGFEVWLKILALPIPACEDGAGVVDGVAIKAAASLGLTLAPLAGPGLRLLPLPELPLSTVAVGVALATWMQPALPALGWLPTGIGGGAPMALLLFFALWLLLRLYARGGAAGVLGLATYFGVGVSGGVALGTL